MKVSRKNYYPEEGENREGDNSENRNSKVCLVLEETDVSMQNSSKIVEAMSFSYATKKHGLEDSVEETRCKRIRQDSRFQSPEISSESESQVEQEHDSQLSTSQDNNLDNLTRKQSRRSSKWIALPKQVSELRTAASSASECEADGREKGNQKQEVKLSATRSKSLKTTHRKKSGKEHKSSKITLVTLRTSQEEDEEEETDDFELYDEDKCFAPEEVNKAPVFVPIGLRSPKSVPVPVEETMEEMVISVNIPDVESLSHASVQPAVQKEEKVNTSITWISGYHACDLTCLNNFAGASDGSTEAAMTLLAMGDPMFQLKTNMKEWTHTLPAQDELDMASSIVAYAYSKESRTPSQYLSSSHTSSKELVPSEDERNINAEDQGTDTRMYVEEHFGQNASYTSNNSLPEANSMGLTRGTPEFGLLRSNENIIQKSLNTNVPVEQLEQVQTERETPRGTAEKQKVEIDPFRPSAGDSLVLHDFSTRSMEFIKKLDKTQRTEMKNPCGDAENLRPVITSPKPEKSHYGLNDKPSQNTVDGLPKQNPCLPEHNVFTINFAQKVAFAQDSQQQSVSSTEDISVVNNDPEEEQTFILTLVEIPADSKGFGASTLLEQASEPLLPAPILISPASTSETSVTEMESIRPLTTAVDEFAASLYSSVEAKQLESASLESIPGLQTTPRRSPPELEENDFPLSAVAVEGNFEIPHKVRWRFKSPFQKTESATEEVLTSVLMSESMSLLTERSQLETLEKASLENSACKQEEEVTSRLNSDGKAEISGPGKQGFLHESGQLEHTASLASPSKTPLLRGGRKPLGFLSLICKKSSSESADETKGNRGKIHKPQIVTPKRSLKKHTQSMKGDGESFSLPSTSTSSSMEYKKVAVNTAVKVPSNESSEKPPLCVEDQEKKEEPTRISEYFFSDIFMEVDDSE
ncbi:BDP1 factor, partial [Turnix velox]|nr:BDP1 factor [Turnix velox]